MRVLRDRLHALILGAIVLGLLHHLDHVIRGDDGWPLTPRVNPFTFSLLVYPAILGGLVLEARGRLHPAYWTVVFGVAFLLVATTHFIPGAVDTPAGIVRHYGNPLASTLSLADLAALALTLGGGVVVSLLAARRFSARS